MLMSKISSKIERIRELKEPANFQENFQKLKKQIFCPNDLPDYHNSYFFFK